MVDVRAGVDAVDAQLVDLLAQRFGYMDAAARNAGIPAEVVGDLWELLVEASIAYELEKWDANRA